MDAGSTEEKTSAQRPLTRADVERLLSQVVSAADLDLSQQNLQQVNLSYMDLQGAAFYYADLQGANLRGAKLNGADLRGANLSSADLDGADLSHARVSDQSTHRVELAQANLRHATLQGLDLRGFDLSGLDLECANLNETDLHDAKLIGTNLCGADLSRALLHGKDLLSAKLMRDIGPTGRPKKMGQGKISSDSPHLQARSAPLQLEQRVETRLSDSEAYLFGKRIITEAYDALKARALFPAGFDFTLASQMFDTWLAQSGQRYSNQERNAMWIGFAHQFCDLYAQNI